MTKPDATEIQLALVVDGLTRLEKKFDEFILVFSSMRDWRIEHQEQAASRDRHISANATNISQLKCDMENVREEMKQSVDSVRNDLRVVLFFSKTPKLAIPLIIGLLTTFLFSVWHPIHELYVFLREQ